ncbi:hypothetical protein AVDCRST_MAG92-2572 [uncultured Coleofasciculus sp.]|uniref:Uncharacterized protein n=1 Tax=uncultured Coleofasciculus sp. TaxID=1267456 RepID=A0A6J4IVF8_9CYAN|nr:hypothetical protein AVDCRST_MAG92-2572 [uncultured Coleofasciculus sp.]
MADKNFIIISLRCEMLNFIGSMVLRTIPELSQRLLFCHQGGHSS